MCPRRADFRRLVDQRIRDLCPFMCQLAYYDLVKMVRSCSTLLASQSWSPGNPDALNNVLRGLAQIALHQNHYCRSLYYWSPPATRSMRLQFRSLLEHLLARYRVPGFLSNAWIDPETREIVQASAKCNNDPTEQSLRIIHEWARREKLVFEERY